MTSLLIDLHGLFKDLFGLAATFLLLVMLRDNQRPHGTARGFWRAAWVFMYITAALTLCLFAVWIAERAA